MENVTEADVAELARMLEAEYGWAIDAGWKASARYMLARIEAANVPA